MIMKHLTFILSCAIVCFPFLASLADDALKLKSSKVSPSSVVELTPQTDELKGYSLLNRVPYEKLGDLVTDRPDFTESSETVEPGWTQWEMTLAQYSQDFDGVEGSEVAWSYGSSLFRIGLLPDWELRLGWNGYSNTRTHDATGANPTDTVGGGGDVNIGFKNKFTKQDKWIPSTAIIYLLSVPIGANNVSSETVDPTVKLCWSYDVSDRLAVSGNFNFAIANPDVAVIDSGSGGPDALNRNRHFAFQPTISVGYSLTDWCGLFGEYYLSKNFHQSIPDQQFFDCGFTFGLTKNLQLDIYTNVGLTKASTDLVAGTGISWRF
jgi:hypothetical protein